jgi:sugar lactone lactonase YvrE
MDASHATSTPKELAPMSDELTPVFDVSAELGECPVWDPRTGSLWWIDWAKGFVYRSDVTSGDTVSYFAGASLSAVAPSPSGLVGLALGHGYSALDPTTGEVRPVAGAEIEQAETRMNDGKCDSKGRFWAGTMAMDGTSAIGALFVLETDGRVRRVLDRVICSNGVGWSADNSTFYYIDSGTYRVDVFDFDLESGTLSNRATLIQLQEHEGQPDGLTVDAEGHLWVALWDGGQVRRYSPTGELCSTIMLPVSRPTCCAFGGADLRDLYITTAMPDAAEERQKQPLAGRVFRTRVETPGVLSHLWRMDA